MSAESKLPKRAEKKRTIGRSTALVPSANSLGGAVALAVVSALIGVS